MMVRTCCPHDCFDACGIEATVEGGRVTSLKGAKEHAITAGFLCGKVSRYLKRQYSHDRLLYPLKRDGSTFRRISWDEALDTVAQELLTARSEWGPEAVLAYSDAGSMGYLKSLELRFWHSFGGATVASGSLCSAAGLAAMGADYGQIRQHDPEDIPNSRLILLWGRNPAVTNIHMIPFLMKAKQRGCRIVLINPMPSESSWISDLNVMPKPGSDAALALGMAAEIIRSGLHDEEFLRQSCAGYASYRKEALSWSLERTSEATGLTAEAIAGLAMEYAMTKPASIWMGFGMQRHAGGGNAVRAVNALGAVTGNIGTSGGGVNYANRSSRVLNPLGSLMPEDRVRNAWKGRIAEDLRLMSDPPVRAAFIARCNPLLQCQGTDEVRRAFDAIPFKVVSDHFMTDTAAAADIILPAATFLEEDELYYSYFHNYISLGRKAVEPAGEAKPDLEVLKELSLRMGFGEQLAGSALDWIKYAIEPMQSYGITMSKLVDQGWVRFPVASVPWTERKFPTSTGKLQIGLPAPPTYIEPYEMPDGDKPFFLLTGALRDRLHSQYDNMLDADKGEHPSVFMSEKAAKRAGLRKGQTVEVFTAHGSMLFELAVSAEMRDDLLYAHHGRWSSRGGGVNKLTKGYLSDMGGQGALYDCAAGIRPVEVR